MFYSRNDVICPVNNGMEYLLVAPNEVVSSFRSVSFSSLFFSTNFVHAISQKTVQPIFIKLSDMIDTNLDFMRIFYFDDVISVSEIMTF